MLVRNIIHAPYWFAQLFTRAKSFRHNPIIGSTLLNRCGLHLLRLLSARAIFVCRRSLLRRLAPPGDREVFNREGYLIKENFLPQDQYLRLVDEINRYQGEAWESIQGDTITRHVFLDYDNLRVLDECRDFVNNQRLLRLLKWCCGKVDFPRFFIQSIMNHYASGDDDPQKVLHSDTFHPTVKCWYFLADVGQDDGPFTYVPGSHRLTWKRLWWEYRRSCIARSLNDGHSEDGSFRIDAAGLTELGLSQPISATVKKNTLVIANVYGFHCRGQAAARGIRTEIFGFFRPNPFNPLPGLDLPVIRRVKQWGIKKFYCYQDELAKKQGKVAFWHLVKLTSRETGSY